MLFCCLTSLLSCHQNRNLSCVKQKCHLRLKDGNTEHQDTIYISLSIYIYVYLHCLRMHSCCRHVLRQCRTRSCFPHHIHNAWPSQNTESACSFVLSAHGDSRSASLDNVYTLYIDTSVYIQVIRCCVGLLGNQLKSRVLLQWIMGPMCGCAGNSGVWIISILFSFNPTIFTVYQCCQLLAFVWI